MIIGITGHTEFLGKELFDSLQKDYEIVGFSRSNGFDLKNYKNFINQIENLDVFINNTYHPTYQQKIFEELFELWKDKDKTIFNVLTSAIFNDTILDEYRQNKLNLQKSSINLINLNYSKKLRVVNLYPNTLEHNKRFAFNKVKFSEVYDIIKFQLDLPQSLELTHICISKTTILNNKTLL
jgi:dTDP-4-dehydrorhamnose reductase